ncbi:THUMP domain-containing protein 1 homolog [Prorops nasuta]|uniref:THUMP domain-containing protein 1 homolog n=1 Tax=Prorops nasuta TaxID=863751 RepID=UPI0034CDA752
MNNKRKKSYFVDKVNMQKRRKQYTLESGMVGFLCTCNFREKECVRDAYKILDEFNDIKSDEDCTDIDSAEDKSLKNVAVKDQNDDNDISTELDKEIEELKFQSEKPVALRTFKAVDTGVKNVIFISTTLKDPLTLVTKIFKDLLETRKQRSRYLLRILPIQVCCKAYMEDIKKCAEVLFEKYFSQEPKTFSIVFNRHTRNNIGRNEIIQDLAAIVMQKNPGNRANLKDPEIAVVVEIIKNICLISIAPNYFRYKKYNMLEICNIKHDDSKDISMPSLDESNIKKEGTEVAATEQKTDIKLIKHDSKDISMPSLDESNIKKGETEATATEQKIDVKLDEKNSV